MTPQAVAPKGQEPPRERHTERDPRAVKSPFTSFFYLSDWERPDGRCCHLSVSPSLFSSLPSPSLSWPLRYRATFGFFPSFLRSRKGGVSFFHSLFFPLRVLAFGGTPRGRAQRARAYRHQARTPKKKRAQKPQPGAHATDKSGRATAHTRTRGSTRPSQFFVWGAQEARAHTRERERAGGPTRERASPRRKGKGRLRLNPTPYPRAFALRARIYDLLSLASPFLGRPVKYPRDPFAWPFRDLAHKRQRRRGRSRARKKKEQSTRVCIKKH